MERHEPCPSGMSAQDSHPEAFWTRTFLFGILRWGGFKCYTVFFEIRRATNIPCLCNVGYISFRILMKMKVTQLL